MTPTEEHIIQYEDDFYEKPKPVHKSRARCSCGATWTLKDNCSEEERQAIADAHRNYKRPLTKPD